jgi:mannobiose 2-epimerase
MYALTEYHQAFKDTEDNNSPALRRANELFELIEVHARDSREGGYFEVRQRDWSEAADSRLSEKDMDEKKSMNNHLHILEAYLNLYRAGKSPRARERLLGLVHLFETRIVDSASCHFNHFFDEHWNVRSNSYTFGHDIEGSWLLCEAAEVLQDALLLQRIRTLAIGIADTVLSEGLDSGGGLCYEGKAGSVIDRRKECWPQAEAVIGFLNAYELSGKEKYLAAAKSVWDYIERLLVDRTHGEWFWRINLDGRPDPDLPKVSEWKGPYHGTRACLEVLKRIPRLAQI